MYDLQALVWLTITALFCGGWFRAYQAKEKALAAVKRHCSRLDLQFLDQSVVLRKVGLRRSSGGFLRFYRCYTFEFSSTGDERYRGEVNLLGNRIEKIDLQAHRLPNENDFSGY